MRGSIFNGLDFDICYCHDHEQKILAVGRCLLKNY